MASIDLDWLPLNCQSFDLNDLPPTEVLVNTEPQPAPELNGTQVAIQGTSNGLDTTSSQSGDLTNLEELLRGAWSAPGPISAGSICLREKSARDEDHIVQNDCKEALYPGSRPGISRETPILLDYYTSEDEDAQDPGREAGSSSEVHGHDGSTLKEHERTHSGERAEKKGPWSAPASSSSDVNGTDDTDEVMSDLEFAQLRSLPTPVFRMPPSWQDFQQRENTISSSRSSGAGDSQDDPLVIDDDGGKTGESGTSTKATSVEPETETAYLLSSLRREDLKTLRSSDIPIAPDHPVEPLDRLTSPNVALPQHLTQTDDKAEEEEANTEPTLTPSRERSRDPASGRAEARREPAQTQTSGCAAASGHKRDRQSLHSGSLNVMPPTDRDDIDTDYDDDDIRPLLKKRTVGKPLVVQNEEPDSIAPKAGHADTLAGLITPAPSLKGATDDQPSPVAPPPHSKQATNHQPSPMAPPPRPKRASGHSKAAHIDLQEWEIKKIAGARRIRRGWEYKVVWANSWVPRSDLGNAQRLLREFESKDST